MIAMSWSTVLIFADKSKDIGELRSKLAELIVRIVSMWTFRTRTWFASTAMALASLTGPFLYAQNPPASVSVGLPPVIESLGADDPPDLPTSSTDPDSVTAAVESNPSAPLASPVRAGSGSVLDSLDNLPPVGVAPPRQRASSQPLTTGEPLRPGSGPQPDPISPSRVVRFGDVKSESSVQDQFRDRRSADRNTKPGTGTNSPSFRPEEPSANRPKTFLEKLMPWRRPAQEPPLIRDKASASDELDTHDTPSASGKPRNRAELADQVDTEIQRRVERVARQEAGSRTNELNVEVVNREVYIRARPMWFWQRRQLSEDLQKLPGIDSKRLHVTVY